MKRNYTEHRVIQIKDINIGDNIKVIRENLGLHQTDVVRELQLRGVDISPSAYNKIEKGKQNPTVSFLFGMCEILNCDVNDLFGM